MAKSTIELGEYLGDIDVEGDSNFLREAIILLTRLLMEPEVSEQIGVERYQRSENRQGYRNGYRDRVRQTRAGEIPLQIAKLRPGSYHPGFKSRSGPSEPCWP